MNILINFLLVLECLVAVLMMFVILMQRPKSEGLGAAFGGGVTENIFGAQTTNVLTTATSWLAGIFFALALILSVLYAHKSTVGSAFRKELAKGAVVAPTAAPAKAAAKAAAADAKAQLNPAPKNTVPPVGSVPSPPPAAAAIGVVPAGNGTVTQPSAAPSATP